jgi:hypothetical protein
VAALGDLDGDGVIDLAIGSSADSDGSSYTGSVYITTLEQSYCGTPAPTASPASGACYHHTSTVTRVAANGIDTAQVPLTELQVGHRILALDQHANHTFAKIEALPHGPAAEPYVHIDIACKARHELLATPHHTFDAFVSETNDRERVAKRYSVRIVEAKDLKAGDCLRTTEGVATIHSIKLVASKDSDVTYSTKLAGNVGTVAIGGVFTHAMNYVHLPGHRNGAHGEFKIKMSPMKPRNTNEGHSQLH